ncbi:thioredoxin family protein [Liquorilactobacillus sicerae]|uniref:thioredoxin family protein n=1 Tax=Liquorilactobacillus sicerae TaxID=1416943 RepID=UPI0024809331|nr:thioredoxin family protein [Liquorilactobacillus sicerae]
MQKLEKIDQQTLQQKFAKGKFVFFFEAGWCPDCQFIKPAMPEIEKDFPQYKFIKIDRDENLDLCQEMGILGIPSFVVYENGKEISRFVNKDRKTKAEVETFLTKA